MESRRNDPKLDRLHRIYQLFEKTMDPFKFACGIRCDACCTCNVTLTGLEAEYLVKHLEKGEKKRVLEKLDAASDRKRYQPQLTTNAFARYCIEDRPVPQEDNDPHWGKCPLFAEARCSVYPGRPFGCRAMVSKTPCQKSGIAEIPPLAQTVQNIFLQAVEHLDQGGIFGNLTDVLRFVIDDSHDTEDEKQESFLINEKIPALMIPPGHRQKTGHLIQDLSGILQ